VVAPRQNPGSIDAGASTFSAVRGGRIWWCSGLALLVLSGCARGASLESQIVLPPQPQPAASTTTVLAAPPSPAAAAPSPTTPRANQVWTPVTGNLVGLRSECGNVALGARPDQDMMVAGISRNGLFAASAASDQWSPLGAGSRDAINNRLSQILDDPANQQTFWEAGIYGPGVYRTDDNGATFHALGGIDHIDSVSVDFSDPARRTLLAGRHESSTVYRSSDGGAHWDELSGLPPDIGNAAAPYVVDANTYLVGSFAGPGSGVHRTTDGGATWTKVFDKGVAGPPVARDGTIVWLQDGGSAVISSTDGGATWTAVNTGGFVNGTAMIGLPDGGLASWHGKQVAMSPDGGRTWKFVGPPMPYQPNGIAWSAAGNTFYAWRFDCADGDNPPTADSIIRLDAA
jgi:photosystem II stability/assembly factor-like uncharacterized protein